MTSNCRNPLEKKVILQSGQKCNISGEYEVQGTISTSCYVTKGELMPLYCGKKVKWKLIIEG